MKILAPRFEIHSKARITTTSSLGIDIFMFAKNNTDCKILYSFSNRDSEEPVKCIQALIFLNLEIENLFKIVFAHDQAVKFFLKEWYIE